MRSLSPEKVIPIIRSHSLLGFLLFHDPARSISS